MYPSDYGYATSGGSTTDRATCLNKDLYHWSDSSVSDCKKNDWLFNGRAQWTLSPYADSALALRAFNVLYDVYSTNANEDNGVRPAVYLSSNTKVLSGDGSSGNPFILS